VSTRAATTFAVPEQLWETDAMLEALAARDVAQIFRLIQRETRVSQTHLGVATGLSQAQVSEIIGGARRVSSIDVLTRITAGLCMPSDARVTLLLGDRSHLTTPAVPAQADPSTRDATEQALTRRYADVEAVYPSRSEFTSMTAGNLGALTTLNLQGILRVRDRLPAEIRDRIEVATYDQTIRVNITLINDSLCIAQQYLPHARGVESPTMVIKKRWPVAGLYHVFERTFDELWSGGQPR
jgi:hypothetical protein